MEKEKKRLIDWVRQNKWRLIVSGVSIVAIIAIIIGIKNYSELEEIKKSLLEVSKRTSIPSVSMLATNDAAPTVSALESNSLTTDRIPHDVVEHLRNLPEGWKASPEKVAKATERGYVLLPGQTWVEAYRTGGVAA